MNVPEKRRIKLIITGKVQGVYFRQSTREEAYRLGLSGWVKNEADGAVSAEAQGTPEQLERLIAWCRQGPPRAQVNQLEIEWLAVKAEEAPFQILY
ncbi:MAG: acylphosphatase [Candidatus Obscuribacterales bacterium]|nr:acylphosphatase [Candidatus Obscuribacterales bacterium]